MILRQVLLVFLLVWLPVEAHSWEDEMWQEYRDRYGKAFGGSGGEGAGSTPGGLGFARSVASAPATNNGRVSTLSRSRSGRENFSSGGQVDTALAAGRASAAANRARREADDARRIASAPAQTSPLQVDTLSRRSVPVSSIQGAPEINSPQVTTLKRTTTKIDDFNNAPTLRLTPQGVLIPNNRPPTSEGNRLGSNDGGDQGAGQSEPIPFSKPTPPAQPSPPAARQRAAALQRGPSVDPGERTLLTLSLADVTRKSLLGV